MAMVSTPVPKFTTGAIGANTTGVSKIVSACRRGVVAAGLCCGERRAGEGGELVAAVVVEGGVWGRRERSVGEHREAGVVAVAGLERIEIGSGRAGLVVA